MREFFRGVAAKIDRIKSEITASNIYSWLEMVTGLNDYQLPNEVKAFLKETNQTSGLNNKILLTKAKADLDLPNEQGVLNAYFMPMDKGKKLISEILHYPKLEKTEYNFQVNINSSFSRPNASIETGFKILQLIAATMGNICLAQDRHLPLMTRAEVRESRGL